LEHSLIVTSPPLNGLKRHWSNSTSSHVVIQYLFLVPLQDLQTPQRNEWLSDRDTHIAGHILTPFRLLKVH
jgi:hypothetical protein